MKKQKFPKKLVKSRNLRPSRFRNNKNRKASTDNTTTTKQKIANSPNANKIRYTKNDSDDNEINPSEYDEMNPSENDDINPSEYDDINADNIEAKVEPVSTTQTAKTNTTTTTQKITISPNANKIRY